jgi:DNA modification methylase
MIYQGNCLDILPTLESGSIQSVVTSPPYFGLRDYGVDGQIGLEDTPEAYVEKMVAVFREVRRILRDDGTVWLNLGDSYNGSGKAGSNPEYQAKHTEFGKPSREKSRFGMPTNVKTLKPKDLIGIPWRVAFAFQADGWWLRSDIIWHKPNPMPESVTDRCTKSHEYIFLLTKSAKYFYDAEAIKEPAVYGIPNSPKSISSPYGQGFTRRAKKISATYRQDGGRNDGNRHPSEKYTTYTGKRNRRSVWTVTTKPFSGAHFAVFPPEIPEICIKAGSKVGDTILDPFSGAGTTGLVAEKLGRNFVGIELNPDYAEMAEKRINNVQPLLFAVTA